MSPAEPIARRSTDDEVAAKMATQVRSLLNAMRRERPGWYGRICLQANVADGSVDLSRAMASEIEETVKLKR